MKEIPEHGLRNLFFRTTENPLWNAPGLVQEKQKNRGAGSCPFPSSFECATEISCHSLAVQTATSNKQFQTFNPQISGFCGLLVDSLKIIRHIYPLAAIFDTTIHPISPCYPQFVNKYTGQPLFSPQGTLFVGVIKGLPSLLSQPSWLDESVPSSQRLRGAGDPSCRILLPGIFRSIFSPAPYPDLADRRQSFWQFAIHI